jgi:hypothetical protein
VEVDLDVQLTGAFVIAVAALPYVVEVLRQVPLQARLFAILPPEIRARLPPHPRRPWLTVFGSVRFFLALFRYALRDTPEDTNDIAALKRKMRASAIREGLFAALFIAVLATLLAKGWRPAWPRFGD